VCGLLYKYADCRYLNPSSALSSWTPIVQIKSKVITAIKGSNRLRANIEKNFLRNKIDLPNFWPTENSRNHPEKAKGDNVASTSSSVTAMSRASFATSKFAFSTAAKDEYDDYFRLDNCADTHVCNDLSRSTQYQPLHDEIIRFGDADTHIEGTGNVAVHINTPSGPSLLQLENVAYVPGVKSEGGGVADQTRTKEA
jgi:hypothetical protein